MHSNTILPESSRVPDSGELPESESESPSGPVNSTDTIVAVATPPGRGGISIIRISGPDVVNIATRIIGVCPVPRYAHHASFLDRNSLVIDNGIALYFPAPHSFTGESVLELQGHGSPVVMQMLLQNCLALGARLAQPGEFSQRAFLNGRLDLAQAEAIADLIDSSTQSAARSAINSLQGGFSRRINELVEKVTLLRVFVEAAIDFPDEEIDFLEGGVVADRVEHLLSLFASIKSSSKQGMLMREGLKVVLTGLPNAGKSSLLNRLCNAQRAIVSDIPGTTRDVLGQFIEIDGLPVEIIDTAGIRPTTNEIEAEGVRRAIEAQNQAGLVLLLVDDTETSDQKADSLLHTLDTSGPVLLVRNKIDLTHRSASTVENEVCVSALTGEGFSDLEAKIKTIAGFRGVDDSSFLARERHVNALNCAEAFLVRGLEQHKNFRAGELLADDLSSCQKVLGEITGAVSSDDLLGMIFNSFCIGK